jgi:hypothetical protein
MTEKQPGVNRIFGHGGQEPLQLGMPKTLHSYFEFFGSCCAWLETVTEFPNTVFHVAENATSVSLAVERHAFGSLVLNQTFRNIYTARTTCVDFRESSEPSYVSDSGHTLFLDSNVGAGTIGLVWVLMLTTSAAKHEFRSKLIFAAKGGQHSPVGCLWAAMRDLYASFPCDLGRPIAPFSPPTSETGPIDNDTDAASVAADAGSEQPLTRREALQRRMPPREGIQAIIDRSKGKQRPWFDDKYDWVPKD